MQREVTIVIQWSASRAPLDFTLGAVIKPPSASRRAYGSETSGTGVRQYAVDQLVEPARKLVHLVEVALAAIQLTDSHGVATVFGQLDADQQLQFPVRVPATTEIYDP